MTHKPILDRIGDYLNGLKQTGRFHPTWILLVVAVSIIVALIMWVPAEVVPKIENVQNRSVVPSQ